jgi:hypothetical protein
MSTLARTASRGATLLSERNVAQFLNAYDTVLADCDGKVRQLKIRTMDQLLEINLLVWDMNM